MENMFDCSVAMAAIAHKGQTRWGGALYITHPMRVALSLTSKGELVMTVGMIHDVVEDTKGEKNEITLKDIREIFGDVVADAVDSVTKRDGESYEDFVRRSSENKIGKLVKMADLEDNINDTSSGKVNRNKEKYEKALRFLKGVE